MTTVRTGLPKGASGTTALDADAMHYQAPNPQGTASTDVTADSLTVSRHTYTPFGEERTIANTGLLFAGQRGFLDAPTDPTTGLTTLGVRQYNPTLGRFLSVDPQLDVGDPQSMNGYAYSDNDPVNGSDPDGFCVQIDGVCGTHNFKQRAGGTGIDHPGGSPVNKHLVLPSPDPGEWANLCHPDDAGGCAVGVGNYQQAYDGTNNDNQRRQYSNQAQIMIDHSYAEQARRRRLA